MCCPSRYPPTSKPNSQSNSRPTSRPNSRPRPDLIRPTIPPYYAELNETNYSLQSHSTNLTTDASKNPQNSSESNRQTTTTSRPTNSSRIPLVDSVTESTTEEPIYQHVIPLTEPTYHQVTPPSERPTNHGTNHETNASKNPTTEFTTHSTEHKPNIHEVYPIDRESNLSTSESTSPQEEQTTKLPVEITTYRPTHSSKEPKPVHLPHLTQSDLPAPGVCGVQPKNRILRGEMTRIDEYPW